MGGRRGDGPAWDDADPLVARALAAAVDAVPLRLAVLDAAGRVVRASPGLAELAGLPGESLLGREVAEVLGELAPAVHDAVAEASATAAPRSVEVAGRTASGSDGSWTVAVAPLPYAGDGLAVLSVTGRGHESDPRLQLLRRAGELLGSSLEPAQTLENLCELLVPALADHAFVDLHDGDVLRRVALRHAPGVRVEPRLQRPVGIPAGYAPHHPAQRAFDHGEVLLVPDLAAAPDAVPPGADTAFVREMGTTALMVLPLRAGRRVLGIVALMCSVSGRHYDEADLALVQEVVASAAQAVVNALRYTEQRNAAVELQRALLPASLPPVEGLDVAWRYVPGTADTEAGGDWADVVELPGGRVALVIGDVMGRGLRAAAVMGQLRTAVRALAITDPPPADLMAHLDVIVAGLVEDQIVTCLYGVYDPARGTVTYANAGHLPPLLVLDGHCQPLDGVSAVPLGVGGVEFTERVVPMPRGALLALYTDGLVERRHGDLDVAVDRLCSALVAFRGTLEERCAALLLHSAPDGPAGFDDDVAVLLVQAQADPADVAVRHALPAAPESVAVARELAAEALRTWGVVDEDAQLTAALLVSELVTNAVRYAQGDQVELVLRRGRTAVWVEVGDRDTRSPRLRHASPDDEGGRGLALVQALSSAWGSRTLRDGKVVWVRLDVRPETQSRVGVSRSGPPVAR